MRRTLLPIIGRAGLAASLSFFTLTASAQKHPCKYVKEATDPFTKKVSKGAQMVIGDPFALKEVAFVQEDGKLYFGLNIVFTDMDNMPFKKEDKISFKLANDDLIEISPDKDVQARDIRVMDMPCRQWLVIQKVSEDVYKRLAASPIVAIKYHLKNDYIVNGIKERQTKKIMENAACMLANQ